MAMNFNKQNEIQEPLVEVRKGKISKTKLYKYLGDHYDDKGSNKTKISKKMCQSKYMASYVRRVGSYDNVGHADVQTRLLLVDSVVKMTLLSQTETWCSITPKEETNITSKHHEVLCTVFGLKQSTPYYGIIAETGIWPYKDVITYKKLMFLHHLIHSEPGRVCRQIVVIQQEEQMEETWYGELEEKTKEMGINIKKEVIQKYKKSEWKKHVKEKITKKIEEDLQKQYESKTKLRFLKGKQFQQEQYFKVANAAQCKLIMEIRLNMLDLKMNFKGMYDDTVCTGCFAEEESTEHFLQCKKYMELTQHNIKTTNIEEDIKSTEWLIRMAKQMETLQKVRKHRLQYS